jgi:hypothetical protein
MQRKKRISIIRRQIKNKTSILSKFNRHSKKRKLTLFIAIFAIVGGIWFTYTSYASTRIRTCTESNCLKAEYIGWNAFSVSNNDKANTRHYLIRPGGRAYTSKIPVLYEPRGYDICVVYSGTGHFNYYAHVVNGITVGPRYLAGMGSTETTCISVFNVWSGTSFLGAPYRDIYGEVKVIVGDVRVHSIYFNQR